MPTVKIEEKGCRGCTLCVDICPGEVFDYREAEALAVAAREVDCIGCYSCYYLCPSQCIQLGDVELQRPFHRIESNVALMEKFLQEKTATRTLTVEDWQEAYKDVSVTMSSLADATVEMLGRGAKALGRKAGSVSSTHLPEIYEETDLDGVLTALKRRFENAFTFDYEIAGEELIFTFQGCGCGGVVRDAGQKIGEAMLCKLFHDYVAGLIGAYTGRNYRHEVPTVGETCVMRLTAA